MKTVIIMAIMIALSSCSKSLGLEDNTPPFPRNNTVLVRFITEQGEDALDRIEMKLKWVNTSFPDMPVEYYEMVSENYTYRCLIDGTEVPLFTEIDGECVSTNSLIKVEICKIKAEEYKIFRLVLCSDYIIHNDIKSERLYEFDYKIKLPSLFGEKENSLKVIMKAKNLGKRIYENASFNGKEISPDNGNIFNIVVGNT